MNQENWKHLSKSRQIGAIAAEIVRADIWEKTDKEKFNSAIERALNLIDLTLNDRRWQKQFLSLLCLREEFAKFYLGIKKNVKTLYAIL